MDRPPVGASVRLDVCRPDYLAPLFGSSAMSFPRSAGEPKSVVPPRTGEVSAFTPDSGRLIGWPVKLLLAPSGADLTFATPQPRAREANVKSKAPLETYTC